MSGHSTANDLAARLRDLRGRYPSLSVTTELLRLDEILVAFQAVVALNGVPRPAGMRSVLRSRAVSSSRRRRLRRSPRPCCWAASTTMRLTSLRSCPPGRPRRRSWCPAYHPQARRRTTATHPRRPGSRPPPTQGRRNVSRRQRRPDGRGDGRRRAPRPLPTKSRPRHHHRHPCPCRPRDGNGDLLRPNPTPTGVPRPHGARPARAGPAGPSRSTRCPRRRMTTVATPCHRLRLRPRSRLQRRYRCPGNAPGARRRTRENLCIRTRIQAMRRHPNRGRQRRSPWSACKRRGGRAGPFRPGGRRPVRQTPSRPAVSSGPGSMPRAWPWR